jgi:hypothetical protein
MPIQKGNSRIYGGGKRNYGNGGFGGSPRSSCSHISQEKWDAIFKSKEKKIDETVEKTN